MSILDNFFFGSSNLFEIDFSNFDIKSVTSMRGLFKGCYKLDSIIYGNNFVTNNLVNINELFCACSSLIEIDLNKYNTSKVEQMNSLFEGCSKLTKINLDKIDTSNVVSMRNMFRLFNSKYFINFCANPLNS